jgi:hypothetical protein
MGKRQRKKALNKKRLRLYAAGLLSENKAARVEKDLNRAARLQAKLVRTGINTIREALKGLRLSASLTPYIESNENLQKALTAWARALGEQQKGEQPDEQDNELG